MFDFHEKRKMRNLVFSKFTIVVLLILIALLSMSVFERFVALRGIAEKEEQKKAELQALEERAEALRANVQYLQKGRGVEEELRNRFDVAKEGEQVVVIVGEGTDIDAETLAEPPGGEETTSFWDWLKFW